MVPIYPIHCLPIENIPSQQGLRLGGEKWPTLGHLIENIPSQQGLRPAKHHGRDDV